MNIEDFLCKLIYFVETRIFFRNTGCVGESGVWFLLTGLGLRSRFSALPPLLDGDLAPETNNKNK